MSLESALMETEDGAQEEGLPEEILRMSSDELVARTRLLDNEVTLSCDIKSNKNQH